MAFFPYARTGVLGMIRTKRRRREMVDKRFFFSLYGRQGKPGGERMGNGTMVKRCIPGDRDEDEGDEDEGDEDEWDEDEGDEDEGDEGTSRRVPFLSIDNPPDIGASAP